MENKQLLLKIFLLNMALYCKVGFSWLVASMPSIDKNVTLFKCYTFLKTNSRDRTFYILVIIYIGRLVGQSFHLHSCWQFLGGKLYMTTLCYFKGADYRWQLAQNKDNKCYSKVQTLFLYCFYIFVFCVFFCF